MAILGGVCFYLFMPASGDYPSGHEKASKFTKSILKSKQINASNGELRLSFDQYHDMVLVSKLHRNSELYIETTFLDGEFLHEETAINRFLKTNESCAQVSLEIICCETFCQGKLKEGHIITRYFARNSQYCGAWRYDLNSAYICTRKKDQIIITEFWSTKDYRLR